MRTEAGVRSAEVSVRLCAASMTAAQFFIEDAPDQSLEDFINDLDRRTFYSDGHSVNVARYAADIHREFGADRDQVARRYYAGLLHDIGKVGVPTEILGKPGPLTDDEFDVVKAHADMGAEVVAAVEHLEDLAAEIRHHHERFDGTGYPHGLAGEAIPFAARVLAVADAFDAMTSDRVYRRALPRNQAILELARCAGGQLDAQIVDAFLGTLDLAETS